MPDDPPIPAPGDTPKPPTKKAPRPPAPGWMWAVFGFGMVPVGALICAATLPSDLHEMVVAIVFGAWDGLLLGLPMLAGLVIASRFFDDSLARFVGGLIFGWAIIAGLAGIAFAGLAFVMQGTTFR